MGATRDTMLIPTKAMAVCAAFVGACIIMMCASLSESQAKNALLEAKIIELQISATTPSPASTPRQMQHVGWTPPLSRAHPSQPENLGWDVFLNSGHPTTKCPQDSNVRISVGGVDMSMLNDKIEDVAVIYKFVVFEIVYWRVMPHPCAADLNDVASRLQHGYGFGPEALFSFLLGPTVSTEPVPFVIDVGANLGGYTLAAASMGYRTVGYEIQGRRVREIKLMAALNGWTPRLTIHHAAVTTNPQETWSCVDPPFGALSGRCLPDSEDGYRNLDETAGSYTIQSKTAADIFPPGIEVCLLKLDCDGCEPAFMPGFLEQMQRNREASVQVGPKFFFFEFIFGGNRISVDQIAQVMELGYVLHIISPHTQKTHEALMDVWDLPTSTPMDEFTYGGCRYLGNSAECFGKLMTDQHKPEGAQLTLAQVETIASRVLGDRGETDVLAIAPWDVRNCGKS